MNSLLILPREGCPLNRIFQNEKGAAFVVTLAIVAILIAAAFQLAKFTGNSVMVTEKEKNQFQAEQLAVSGINLAQMILSNDAAKSEIDSIQETWADQDMLEAAVNEMGLTKETLVIKITDELSKIQLNALIKEFPGSLINHDQRIIWENFLRARRSNDNSLDKNDPAEIINSVKDWLDSLDDDTISGISGAESDYYLDLDSSYTCANGPFNHIGELLNVKGVSKEILNIEDMDEPREEAQEIDMGDIFTVFGLSGEKSKTGGYSYPGRININTASLDVLIALLPEGMEDLARDLDDFRKQKNEKGDDFVNLLDKGWYNKVIELSGTGHKRFARVIRYSSDVFRIESFAREKKSEITLVAYVQRAKHKESGKWVCRIIQMERK